MKQKRKVKKIPIVFILTLLIFVFIVIPFIILKITEDGQYYVEDLNTSEVQASYKHYIFASFKMDTIDSKYVCIKDGNGKILRLQSGIVNLKTKDITENTEKGELKTTRDQMILLQKMKSLLTELSVKLISIIILIFNMN